MGNTKQSVVAIPAPKAVSFHDSIKLIPVAMAVTELDSQCLTAVNPDFVRFSGWEKEEALGQDLFELGFWQNREQQRKYGDLLDRYCGVSSLETIIKTKSGQPKTVLWSALTLRTSPKSYIVHSWTDVSFYKEREAVFRLDSQKLNLVIDDINDGVFVVQDWFCKKVNRRGAQLVGAPIPEVMKKSVLEYFHPDERDQVRKAIIRFMKGGVASNSAEQRIVDARGVTKWVELRCMPADWRGEPALIAFATDITRRKTAEEELWKKNCLLKSIIEGTADCVWIRDLQGVFRLVSSSLAEHFGVPPEQVVGKKPTDFLVTEEASSFLESDKRVAESGKKQTIEAHYTLHGRVHTFLVSRAPYRDKKGNIVGVIGISRDISELKENEDQLRFYQDRLRSLSMELDLAEERERRKIASDLHDNIGQNLTLATIKLDALQKTTGQEDLQRPLRQIRSLLGKSIMDIRSSIFELSPPVLHHFGLKDAVDELGERLFQERGQRVLLRDDGLPKPLDCAVRDALYRAVRELLVNSYKHSGTDRVEVLMEKDGENCRVTVRDEGAGFDPEDDKQGFGLFSIRERMDLLGGRLELNSEPGQGTRVSLVVPMKKNLSGEKDICRT